MKWGTFVLAVVCVALAASSSWAGIYYEQEIKMPGAMGTGKAVCYVSGPKMRMDSTMQGMQTIVIQRFDTGMVYNLLPAQKMCMETRIPKLNPQQDAQIQVAVRATGETKKVGQYNCTRYDITLSGQTVQYWMTTDVNLGDEVADLWQGAKVQSSKLAQELSKLKGFPIMTVVATPQGDMTVTVTTVKKQDVADEKFEVPEGYQKMPAPTGMGGAPPE